MDLSSLLVKDAPQANRAAHAFYPRLNKHKAPALCAAVVSVVLAFPAYIQPALSQFFISQAKAGDDGRDILCAHFAKTASKS